VVSLEGGNLVVFYYMYFIVSEIKPGIRGGGAPVIGKNQ
jgi:hypothetical protein